MANSVHVSRSNGHWKVTLNTKLQKEFTTQAKAKKFGIILAKKKKAELSVHGRNGRVREKNSYGNDPRGTKG